MGFWFDEEKHKYYLDGKLMTGTTTVLSVLAKPALIQWAANLGTAKAYELAESMEPDRRNQLSQAIARAVKKHGKINAAACQDLDREFPEFKEARCAHTKKKEEAGKHGTDTHSLVEDYVKLSLETNEGRPVTDEALGFEESARLTPIAEFVKWSVANVAAFLYSERAMHDPDLFFAGTADFGYVGTDGRRYVGDFKTSSGIYGIDYWLQVAAYRYLAEKEGDAPYDGMTVVRIGKEDGACEIRSVYEYDTFREVFLACMAIYRAQQVGASFEVR